MHQEDEPFRGRQLSNRILQVDSLGVSPDARNFRRRGALQSEGSDNYLLTQLMNQGSIKHLFAGGGYERKGTPEDVSYYVFSRKFVISHAEGKGIYAVVVSAIDFLVPFKPIFSSRDVSA